MPLLAFRTRIARGGRGLGSWVLLDVGPAFSSYAGCVWQYPGEKEITFPPFMCLESHGAPWLERDAKGNEVVIFPLKVPAFHLEEVPAC